MISQLCSNIQPNLFLLKVLDLSYNNIGGSIPDELYSMRDLQRLYLYHNRLTGTISTYIGQLLSLKYLHLSHNVLTGTIPSQLGSSSLPLSELWGSSSNINNEDGLQKPLGKFYHQLTPFF